MSNSFEKYSDVELYEMIKKRDILSEKAFSELYNRFSDRIFNYCYKIMGSYDDAKDVFQETFIKFYQNCESYELLGSVSGLLFTIARNFSLNYNRKNKLFSELSDDMFTEFVSENENAEIMEMINKALDLIPFHQKEAFILRHYQGLSYEEISKIILVDAGIIRNRVKRGMENLAKILKPIFEISEKKEETGKRKKKTLKLLK